MPLGDVAHRRREEVDVLLDLIRDLRAREHRHPRGCELNAQRQALDQPADAKRIDLLIVVQREARLDLRRALDEEAERAGAPVPVLRKAEAVTSSTHSLCTLRRSRDVVSSSTFGARSMISPNKVGAFDEVLEVVQHEQRRPLTQVVKELFLRRDATACAVRRELNRLRNRRRQEIRRCHRHERDKVHAVRVALDPARRGLQREPRLACAARPNQRE